MGYTYLASLFSCVSLILVLRQKPVSGPEFVCTTCIQESYLRDVSEVRVHLNLSLGLSEKNMAG